MKMYDHETLFDAKVCCQWNGPLTARPRCARCKGTSVRTLLGWRAASSPAPGTAAPNRAPSPPTAANTAPPPPDYNAAIRAAAKVAAPPPFVYVARAGHGAPQPPTVADYNAAVCRKAQVAYTRR